MEHSALTAVGDYTGLTEIGRGGSSVVYAACAPDGAQVAIKVFNVGAGDTDTRRRLDREATALEALRDIPGVLGVTDHLFTPDGRPCLVMPLMTGSLAHELAQGPLQVERVLALGEQVAASLAEVHRRGVHHRDLKPANLLVDADGGVWLADFGIAAVGGLELASQTIASLSPPYAPPERFVDTVESGSAAADVYSLAATLFALLAGAPPFGTSNQGGIAGLTLRVMSDPVPPIGRADLPDGLESVLAAAMAKQPLDRWPTMSAFGAALTSVRLGEHVAVPLTDSVSPVDADDDLTVRRDALAAGALIGSVAAGAAAAAAAPPDASASESASSALPAEDEPGATGPAGEPPASRSRVLVGAVALACVLALVGAAMLWVGGAPEESAQEVSVEGATTVAPRTDDDAAGDADDSAAVDDPAVAPTADTVAPDASVPPDGSPTTAPFGIPAPGAAPTPTPAPAVPSSPTPTTAPPSRSPVAAPTPTAPPAAAPPPAPPPTSPPATPPPTVAPKVGDINGDGKVGCIDMRILLDDYGGTAARSDLDKDGTVGLRDLSIFLTNYQGDGTSWNDGTNKCP